MTAAEFAAEYAARGGGTPDALAALGQVVVRCDCDYEECEGWAMVSRRIVEDIRRAHRAGDGPIVLGGTDYSRVHWPTLEPAEPPTVEEWLRGIDRLLDTDLISLVSLIGDALLVASIRGGRPMQAIADLAVKSMESEGRDDAVAVVRARLAERLREP